MDSLYSLRTEKDEFKVEYEILITRNSDVKEINQRISTKQIEISKINEKIGYLTNQADTVDYTTAVACGLISGMIDSFFVGEWDFRSAKAESNEAINKKVIEFAQKDPEYMHYLANKKHSNSDIENAITFLERKYKLPGDGEYKAFSNFGVTNSTHHLDDFSHHPTLWGMISSILVQFSKEAKYYCASGEVIRATIQVNQYGNLVSNNTYGKFFCGIVNWFFTVAGTMHNYRGHLFSDMAGSSTSAGKGNDGAGLPGSFLSILKEMSSLECFKDTEFANNLRKAFQNGIGTRNSQIDLGPFNRLFEGASSKLDLRTEMAIGSELERQSLPVVLNEILVRAIYFVRRFIDQMKSKKSILEIDWSNIYPVGNRTVERMITISAGAFMLVDMADAGIRAGIKTGGVSPDFWADMVLQVNFVGIGRFAVALGTDSVMGANKERQRNRRLQLVNELIMLNGVKIYYKNVEMWIEAERTEKAIEEMYDTMEQAILFLGDSIKGITADMNSIKENISRVNIKSPDKSAEYLKILRS